MIFKKIVDTYQSSLRVMEVSLRIISNPYLSVVYISNFLRSNCCGVEEPGRLDRKSYPELPAPVQIFSQVIISKLNEKKTE